MSVQIWMSFQILALFLLTSSALAWSGGRHFIVQKPQKSNSLIAQSEIDETAEPRFERWLNEEYSKAYIENLWKKHESLITIGAKGFKDSHINSISELLTQHEVVRVKLANTKYMDPMDVSKSIAESDKLKDKAELLEVRKREFMFGRAQVGSGSKKGLVVKEKFCTICEANSKPVEMVTNHNTENCFDNPSSANHRTFKD